LLLSSAIINRDAASSISTFLTLAVSDFLTTGKFNLPTPATTFSFHLWSSQGRIFISGAISYFKLTPPLEGLQQLTSYKSALHVLATFTEQVVTIHKYIPLF